jgi:mannosyl-oligosaccharide alpha-1,2-mannosidase
MLLGGLLNQPRKLYENFIVTAKKHVFYRPMTPENHDILFSGSVGVNDKKEVSRDAEAQHLACFTGGMVGIGSKIFDRPEDLDTARKLVAGCTWAYESMESGIMPEKFHLIACENAYDCPWDENKWYADVWKRNESISHTSPPDYESAKLMVKDHRLRPGISEISDRSYILRYSHSPLHIYQILTEIHRPEAIESVFILYRITGDTAYQDTAWKMFKAIEKHTRTDIAYAAIVDVTSSNSPKSDRMESFWTAETLKYFFLIFSDPEVVSLDRYVLNTEAHTFRRP